VEGRSHHDDADGAEGLFLEKEDGSLFDEFEKA
jgi:hypothetical protein